MFEILKSAGVNKRGLRNGRDTREEILNAAEELLQRRGYSAFSYQHIAVQLGIRNAAIHYHFPAKEDLGVALLRRCRQHFHEWTDQVAPLADAWTRLCAYFDSYAAYAQAEHKVCPIGALGLDFETLPETMRGEARLLMRENLDWLVDVLTQGRVERSMVFIGDTQHKAVTVSVALQGGLQMARIAGREYFQQVLDQLKLELRRPAELT